MAPALTTEPVGQAKVTLKGSPPPEVLEASHFLNIGGLCNTTDQVPQGLIASGNSSIKTINDLNFDRDKSTRGLLKPIQGNGRRHTLFTVENPLKLQKGLKDLGFIQNLPGVLKQIAAREQEINKRNTVSDHLYYHHKGGGKKMNHTPDTTGQNGNGKRIGSQNVTSTPTVNGHIEIQTHIPHKPQVNKFPVPIVKQTGHLELGKMCKTTETASVPSRTATPSPVSSKIQTTGSGIITPVVHPTGDQKKILIKSQEPLLHGVLEIMKVPDSQQSTAQKTEDLMRDATRKEVLLEKRSQFLLRRLRRLQGKQLELQVKNQLKTFTEYQHQNLQIVATKAIRPNVDRENSLFHSNDVKNLSTSALVNLVRKIQTSQSKLSLEQRLSKNSKVETRGVLAMDPSVSAETERKAGRLQTSLKHWSSNVDSDATESSSGGESCDESGNEEQSDQPARIPLYVFISTKTFMILYLPSLLSLACGSVLMEVLFQRLAFSSFKVLTQS